MSLFAGVVTDKEKTKIHTQARSMRPSKKKRDAGATIPCGTYTAKIVKVWTRGPITEKNQNQPLVKFYLKVLEILREDSGCPAVGDELEDPYFAGAQNKPFVFREIKEVVAAASGLTPKEANDDEEFGDPKKVEEILKDNSLVGAEVKLWVRMQAKKEGGTFGKISYMKT